MALNSQERMHEISVEFVNNLDRLERGEITLEDVLAVIDRVEASDPGDERQKRFYAASRELARKVEEVIEKGDGG